MGFAMLDYELPDGNQEIYSWPEPGFADCIARPHR